MTAKKKIFILKRKTQGREGKARNVFGLTTNMKLVLALPLLLLNSINLGEAADKKFTCPTLVGKNSKHAWEVEKVRKSSFNDAISYDAIFFLYQSSSDCGAGLNFTRTSTARMRRFSTLACD